jgi:hypothetical protein
MTKWLKVFGATLALVFLGVANTAPSAQGRARTYRYRCLSPEAVSDIAVHNPSGRSVAAAFFFIDNNGEETTPTEREIGARSTEYFSYNQPVMILTSRSPLVLAGSGGTGKFSIPCR